MIRPINPINLLLMNCEPQKNGSWIQRGAGSRTMTVKQVAERLEVTPSTVYVMGDEIGGRIKVGRQVVYVRSLFELWFQNERREQK